MRTAYGLDAAPDPCHVRGMNQEKLPAGWVVQVAVPAAPTISSVPWIGATLQGAPSFEYYNVGIPAAESAVEATGARIIESGRSAGEMRAVRGLTAAELEVLKLKAGEVRPA